MSPHNPRAARRRHAVFATALAMVSLPAVTSATDAPTGDGLWYYRIGGAEPVSRPANPNVVKVVVDFQGDALYFSRAPIPWVRDEQLRVDAQHSKHLGLYVYRRAVLLEFPTLPPGQWEKLEQLEQLRLLENGYKIRVVETESDTVSVDVPADVAKVEKLLEDLGGE